MSSALRPQLDLLAGELGVFAEARFCFVFKCWTKSASKTLASFDPLVSKDFGNILNIPELRVDLFSLSLLLSNYDDYLHQHE
jgi:hypothetical protein